MGTVDRIVKLLSISQTAIDRTFGIGYAIKNPKLVADIATLANQIEPKDCIVGEPTITERWVERTELEPSNISYNGKTIGSW